MPESREASKDLICRGMRRLTWLQECEHAAPSTGTSHLRMNSIATEQCADLVDLRMAHAQRDQQVVVHLAQLLKRKESCHVQRVLVFKIKNGQSA